MYIFRTGNELIIKLTVPQSYICAAKVLKGDKRSVKNDPWALFVEKPDFRVFLPPDLGLKCAF